jgi:hypothetical protein
MNQLAGLAVITLAVIAPIGTARAILGAILTMLVKHRERM